MSNGDIPEWNCATGACCATIERRKDALALNLVHHLIGRHPQYTPGQCTEIADLVLDLFDIAPKGTLVPIVQAIANGEDYAAQLGPLVAAITDLAQGPAFDGPVAG